MVISLQRLGYLPMATARLQADLTHHVGQIPDLSQMQTEVQRLKEIQGADPTVKEQLNEIETQLVKAKLVDKIDNVSNIIESKGDQNEQDE